MAKVAVAPKRQYIKNVAKSFGYAAIDVAASLNPTLAQAARETKMVASEVQTSVRSMFGDDLTQTIKGFVDPNGDNAINNLINDLKTGEWYNKKRKDSFGFDDFDMDFGDSEDWGDDDSFDMGGDEGDESSSGATASSMIAGMQNLSADISVSMGKASATSAQYIAASSHRDSKAVYDLTKVGFGNVTSMLLSINNKLDAVLEIGAPLVTQAQNTFTFQTRATEFFESTTETLNKMNSSLEQIAANTAILSGTNKKSRNRKATLADLVFGDEFDISGYFNMLKENAKESADIIKSFAGMAGMMGGKNLKNVSPMAMAMTYGIQKMIPDVLKESMKSFNTVLDGAIPELLKRGKRKAGNSFLGMLLDSFFPDMSVKNKINKANYEKGPVPWDGVARKAVVEVIPTYLAKILSAVGGQEERYFDYGKGTFTTKRAIKQDFAKRTAYDARVASSAGSFRQNAFNAAGSDKQKREMAQYFINAITTGIDHTDIRKNLGNRRELAKMGLSPESALALLQVMDSMAKGDKSSRAELAKYNRAMLQAQGKISRRYRDEEESGYSNLNYLDSGFGSAKAGRFSQIQYLNGIYNTVGNIYALLAGGKFDPKTGKLSSFGSTNRERSNMMTNIQRSNYNNDIDIIEGENIDDENLKSDYENRMQRAKEEGEKFRSDVAGFLNKKSRGIRNWFRRLRGKNEVSEKDHNLFSWMKAPEGKFGDFVNGAASVLDSLSMAISDTFYGDHNDEGIISVLRNNLKSVFNEIRGKIRKSVFGTIRDTAKRVGGNFVKGYRIKSKQKELMQDGYSEADAYEFAQDFVETEIQRKKEEREQRRRERLAEQASTTPTGAAGGRNVTRSGLIAVSEGELIIPSEYNPFYRGKTNKRRQIANENRIIKNFYGSFAEGGTAGAPFISDEQALRAGYIVKGGVDSAAGAIAGGVSRFVNAIIGDLSEKGIEDSKKKLTSGVKKVFEDMGLNKSAMGIGAIGGLGVSLLTGAFIGPIAGAAIGAGAGLISKSETLQKLLFGEIVEENDGKGGTKKVHTKGLGKALDFIKEKISDVKDAAKEKFKGKGGSMLAGAGIGSLLGPFGIIGGALLGGGLGFLATTDKFKRYMFGDGSKDDKSFTGLLRNKVFNNLDEIFHNTGNMLKGLFKDLGSSLKDFLKKTSNSLLARLAKTTIGRAGGRLAGFVGSAAKVPINLAGSVLGGVNRAQQRFNLRHGYNLYDRSAKRNMDAATRLQRRSDLGGFSGSASDRNLDRVIASLSEREFNGEENEYFNPDDLFILQDQLENAKKNGITDAFREQMLARGLDLGNKAKVQRALDLISDEVKAKGYQRKSPAEQDKEDKDVSELSILSALAEHSIPGFESSLYLRGKYKVLATKNKIASLMHGSHIEHTMFGDIEVVADKDGNTHERTDDAVTDATQQRRNRFFESIEGLPIIGGAVKKMSSLFGSLHDKLFGPKDDPEKKGLFGTLFDFLSGTKDSIISKIGDFLSGGGVGGFLKAIKGNLSFSNVFGSLVGPMLVLALTGAFDGIFNKLFGRLKLFKGNDPSSRGAFSSDELQIPVIDPETGEPMVDPETGEVITETSYAGFNNTLGSNLRRNTVTQAIRGIAKGRGIKGALGSGVVGSGLRFSGKKLTTGLLKNTDDAARVVMGNYFKKQATKKFAKAKALRAAGNVAGAKAASAAASRATKNALAAAQGAKVSGLIKSALENLPNILNKIPFLPKVLKGDGAKFLAQQLKSHIDDVVLKLSKTALGKAASSLVKFLPYLNIAWAIAAGVNAWGNAESILGITQDATMGQKCIASVIAAVNALIPVVGDLIPNNVLVNILISILSKLGFDLTELKGQRAAAEEEVRKYNEENGTNLTIAEYNEMNGKAGIFTKMGHGIKNGFGKIKDIIKEKGILGLPQGILDSVSEAQPKSIIGKGAKKIWDAFFSKLLQMKLYATKGSIKELLSYDTTQNEDENKENSVFVRFINAGLNVYKISQMPLALVSWLGQNVFKGVGTGIKVAIQNVTKSIRAFSDTVSNIVNDKFNFLDLFRYEDDPKDPFNDLTKGITIGSRIVAIPIGLTVRLGKELFDEISYVCEGIGKFIKSQADISAKLFEHVKAGNTVALWGEDLEDEDEDNQFSTYIKASLMTQKVLLTPVTMGVGLFNNIFNTLENIFSPVAEDYKVFDEATKKIEEHSKKGEIGPIWTEEAKFNILDPMSGVFNSFLVAYRLLSSIGAISVKLGLNAEENLPQTSEELKNSVYKNELLSYTKGAVGGVVGSPGSLLKNKVMSFIPGVGYINTASNMVNYYDQYKQHTSGGSSFINQRNNAYSNTGFAGSTFGEKGCGPAVASMTASALGKNLPLRSAVRGSYGHQNSVGVDAGYFGDVLGRSGISTQYVSGAGAAGQLAAGNKVILLGQDPYNRSKSRSPFGPGNHYVLATGLHNGKVRINDPENNGPRDYSPSILRNVRMGIAAGSSGLLRVPGFLRRFFSGGGTADDISQIWGFLKSKGLSDVQAAGLMGCWEAESGNSANRIEADYHFKEDPSSIIADPAKLNDYTSRMFSYYDRNNLGINKNAYMGADGNYYPGFGLAQWTGQRLANLIQFARERNMNPASLATQLEFFWSEYQARPKLQDALGNAASIEDATNAAKVHYEDEGYKKDDGGKRLGHAKNIFAQMNGQMGTMPTDASGFPISENGEFIISHKGDKSGGAKSGNIFGFVSEFSRLWSEAFGGLFNGSKESSASETGSSEYNGIGSSAIDPNAIKAAMSGSPSDIMKSIQGQIDYSQNIRNPEQGAADCSSTVSWAIKRAGGPDIGSNSGAQYNDEDLTPIWYESGQEATSVSPYARKDDVLFFRRDGRTENPDSVGHVGLYLGNNQYIHHPGPDKGPKISTFKPGNHLIKISRITGLGSGVDAGDWGNYNNSPYWKGHGFSPNAPAHTAEEEQAARQAAIDKSINKFNQPRDIFAKAGADELRNLSPDEILKMELENRGDPPATNTRGHSVLGSDEPVSFLDTPISGGASGLIPTSRGNVDIRALLSILRVIADNTTPIANIARLIENAIPEISNNEGSTNATLTNVNLANPNASDIGQDFMNLFGALAEIATG